ncbi:alpha/beta fold hydrolase [Ancylobacter pratisalsi]|uniref:Alpha/beta hydrolase n=1 Tax=Ancylobacter pratisalsi TaxID=1745854 RepID=A0A6P1YQV9_9HYPH|nr:alpha/beta hydrolase [Ancylobacter pratisalsi]QIB35171.1 alpha/beta hydrolase [Ancylobacter pratisalsi]
MPMLALNDLEVHYQRMGAGEDVILIHGLGANLAFWYLGGGRHLATSRHLLLYDLRGHGRSSMPPNSYRLPSMVADLTALMSHLGLEQAHIVGHSFGARVALAFAGLHPEKVRSLVVADTQIRAFQPLIRLRDWPHWKKWKEELMSLGLKEPPSDDSIIDFRLLSELNKYGGDLAGTGVARPTRRISLRSRDMGNRGRENWQTMLASTTAGTELEDETPLESDFFSRVTAPTLLLFGELSHCLPTAYALQEHLPRARLIQVPRAGHFFPVVEPVRFARAVDRFLTINELRGESISPPSLENRRGRLRALLRGNERLGRSH